MLLVMVFVRRVLRAEWNVCEERTHTRAVLLVEAAAHGRWEYVYVCCLLLVQSTSCGARVR
jgi:hypothetical protein